MRQEADGDRRVVRTRSALHDAMASLFHEREYGGIVVKEILARAKVGRSTFYAHFRDKDELLRSSIRAMLDAHCVRPPRDARPKDRIDALLAFSLPILQHVAQRRSAHSMPGQSRASVHAELEAQLAERLAGEITRRTTEPAPSRALATTVVRTPCDTALLAAHLAATFVRVIEWWVDRPEDTPAEHADGMFRSLVRPVLETQWK